MSARLTGVSPVLLVADVTKAADYFAAKLGFTVPHMWGDPPHFCIPTRDGMAVMLNQVSPGDRFEPNASLNGRYDVYFDVDDCDALHAEFEANGADIVCAPEDQPYYMREFQVRDPDGHLLAFGHPIGEAS